MGIWFNKSTLAPGRDDIFLDVQRETPTTNPARAITCRRSHYHNLSSLGCSGMTYNMTLACRYLIVCIHERDNNDLAVFGRDSLEKAIRCGIGTTFDPERPRLAERVKECPLYTWYRAPDGFHFKIYEMPYSMVATLMS